jgi:hypothetical protein
MTSTVEQAQARRFGSAAAVAGFDRRAWRAARASIAIGALQDARSKRF